MEVLDKLEAEIPEMKGNLDKIRRAYHQKLYHNISEMLVYVFMSKFSGELLLEVYQYFVKQFEEKMNSLALCKIVMGVTDKLKDQVKAHEFIQSVIKRIEGNRKEITEGTICLRADAAATFLRNNQKIDQEKVKGLLDEVEQLIQKKGFVDAYVNAHYFRVLANFYEKSAQYHLFYSTGLRFLSYVNMATMTPIAKEWWSYHIGIAALVGKGVYNFGELLCNPVFKFLEKSPKYGWLVPVLRVYNKGDIDGFTELSLKHKEKFDNIPILKSNVSYLAKKIQLMAILELVFQRGVDDRNISFEQIAKVTKCDIQNVEFMLLKALASRLIDGVINEVEKTVYVRWCQPRVLDRGQTVQLRDKLKNWYESIKDTQRNIID